MPTRARPGLPRAPPRKRTLTDLQREVKINHQCSRKITPSLKSAFIQLSAHNHAVIVDCHLSPDYTPFFSVFFSIDK